MQKLTIKKKLILICLAFGVMPLLLYGLINDRLQGESSAEVMSDSTALLTTQIEAGLSAVRINKDLAIEGQLREALLDVQTFARLPSVLAEIQAVEAGYQLEGLDLHAVIRAGRVGPFSLQALCPPRPDAEAALRAFYANQFAPRYLQETGVEAPLEALLNLNASARQLQLEYIANNPNPMGDKHKLQRGGEGLYHEAHARVHPTLAAAVTSYGYYDVFIVSWEGGEVIYSVFKEIDFATSLSVGPQRESPLADVWRALRDGAPSAFSDFHLYTPSYEAPAGFLGVPILQDGAPIAALIVQLPLEPITEVMSERTGLGEGGQVYLVGPDHLMRSDAYRDAETHSVKASFKDPQRGRADSEAIRAGLKGERGVGLGQDYAGREVISAWASVEMMGVRWAIVAELPQAEAYAGLKHLQEENKESIEEMRWIAAGLVLIALLIIGVLARRVAGGFVNPIARAAALLRDVAEGEGDLTQRLGDLGEVELNALSGSFDLFMSKLQALIKDIAATTQALASAATQIRGASDEMTEASASSAAQGEQVSSASEEIANTTHALSSAVEELNASINEIASNAARANERAQTGQGIISESATVINDLNDKAQSIGEVVHLIQAIADQTNLLALNASIEAARAGEAGAGFSVVANEVKQLAGETAEATKRISRRLVEIQAQAGRAVEGIESLSAAFGELQHIQEAVGASVEEQSATTAQLSGSITETAATTEQIAANIGGVALNARRTAELAEGNLDAAGRLQEVTQRLNSLVSRFRV
ncbi:methyl-accepting chemotaxis protein [Myxococcota bacterium]|nr:methyl-accepting chemotaxis protein [Myxococcota bacterium]MBU1429526.1 methyl-accepting chemotaxis protein [Myxococcota bacterium]MBU1899894.1 methyl-accepting chemotaxis protein [Myxococcota bacterium]